MVTKLVADSVIEGRKRFLSYLSQEGVALKTAEKEVEVPAVLPEEEVKIKEIEEIVEEEVALTDGQGNPIKRGRVKGSPDESAKTKRKV